MRRSTLYILILVAAAIISSALLPRIAVLFTSDSTTTEDKDNDICLAPDQEPATIIIPAGEYFVTMRTDPAATQVRVETSDASDDKLAVNYDTSNATLTIEAPDSAKPPFMVTLTLPPSCRPAAISCDGTSTSLTLEDIDLPTLAINGCPFSLSVHGSTIGNLAIGRSDAIAPSFDFYRSKIGTLASAMPMTEVELYICDTAIDFPVFAAEPR